MVNSTRREMLGIFATAGVAAVVDPGPVIARLLQERDCAAAKPMGTFLGTVPLFRTGAPVQPFGLKLGGRGLDARLVTDLSKLDPDHLITPTALAFVRTEGPAGVFARDPWTINVSALAGGTSPMTISELTKRARPMGPHLLECSGNNNPANFGLMSVCEWDGVPLSDVLSRLQPSSDASNVVVSGMDHENQQSADSIGGASWVFPLASVDRLGMFLAVRMNSEPLPLDHGSPVRLVVPGWYGCAWIKWVNEIRLAEAEEPATSQMKEFAGRTHQSKRHDLAREYAPADIQTAATPVRVEKRRGQQGIEYRVIGIVWGGEKPVERLAIRFNVNEAWTPFSICPAPADSTTWGLWEYRWRPSAPGLYDISLTVPDRSVPQRRLDTGYYVRQVKIDDI